MKPFPRTPPFLAMARRVIWFKPPEESLADPIHLVAYAMKHSTEGDMALILDHIGVEGIREALH
jgi:hypothetical protein